MAHAVVEYTDNIAAEADIPGLLAKIGRQMAERSDGVFPVGGVRIRGVRLSDYYVADGEGDDAFVNITVLMGAGRSAEFKKAFFDGLFEEVVKPHFAALFARRPLALSLYVNEADEAGSYKHNNIHARLKAKAAAKADAR